MRACEEHKGACCHLMHGVDDVRACFYVGWLTPQPCVEHVVHCKLVAVLQ